jgi:hypothetical protein
MDLENCLFVCCVCERAERSEEAMKSKADDREKQSLFFFPFQFNSYALRNTQFHEYFYDDDDDVSFQIKTFSFLTNKHNHYTSQSSAFKRKEFKNA